MMMAMIRLDLPSVFAYGGSIRPGCFRGKDVTIQDVYEAIGAQATGKMSLEDLTELECVALPGHGVVREHVHGEHDGERRARRSA